MVDVFVARFMIDFGVGLLNEIPLGRETGKHVHGGADAESRNSPG